MKALKSLVGSRSTTSSASADPQASTSSVFPGLRKLDLPPDTSQLQPLLTLTLSSPSFLDSVVKDDFSGTPLYIIETNKDRTGLFRCDAGNAHGIARLQWPTIAKQASANTVALSGVTVQMHGGRWRPTEDFMKYGSLFTSRKFHIPHHPHSFKWKRLGDSYTCVCSSVKGSVAVLEPAVLSAPPRLKIYSSLLQQDASRPQPNFGGVPLVLIDYLVSTSLILVTDIDEWMHRPVEDVEAARSAMETFLPQSMRNWRKNRASYLSGSSGAHSPSSSVNHIILGHPSGTEDTRSINSDILTPLSNTHPYASADLDSIPPVPEVPIEHQNPLSATPLSRSATRRRLPLPPGQNGQPRPDQPWLTPHRPQSPSEPSSSRSSEPGLISSPPVSPCASSPSREPSRSSGSIVRRALPQRRPPPQLPVPLPPKLINELYNTREMMSSSLDDSSTDAEPSTSYLENEEEQGPSSRHSPDSGHVTPSLQNSFYDHDLPPPAYDAIDFSLPRPQQVSDLIPSVQSISIQHPLPLSEPTDLL